MTYVLLNQHSLACERNILTNDNMPTVNMLTINSLWIEVFKKKHLQAYYKWEDFDMGGMLVSLWAHPLFKNLKYF